MGMIQGETIKLISKIKTGTDSFGLPTYTTSISYPDNVLVVADSAAPIANSDTTNGRKQTVQIAVPKGNTNAWENSDIEWKDKTYHVNGPCKTANASLIPLDWDRIYTGVSYE